MRLINVETLELESFADHRSTPAYAILSHTWGEDEVLFQDVQPITEATRQKLGWKKIEYTCNQAKEDGLRYAWVDTCCIDKSSSAELTEAINSMFAWYEGSRVCYAYLADVSQQPEGQLSLGEEHSLTEIAEEHATIIGVPDKASGCGNAIEQEYHMWATSAIDQKAFTMWLGDELSTTPREERSAREEGIELPEINPIGTATLNPTPSNCESRDETTHERRSRTFEEEFKSSRWFKRGWTLQELLAPRRIQFHSDQWKALGTLEDLAPTVASVTTIPLPLLNRKRGITDYCGARKMSWASNRKTTRIEDEAYCLLGLFQVNMPLLYGERERAFRRLQEEILRSSGDVSIFAWNSGYVRYAGELLATSPMLFSDSGHIHTSPDTTFPSISLRSHGAQAMFQVALIHVYRGQRFFVLLGCYDERFPTTVLALVTMNVGFGYGSAGARNPKALGVRGGNWDDRLHLLQRDSKSRSLEVTLLYTSDGAPATIDDGGLRRICLEENSTREYHMNIPSMGPEDEWDSHIMSHDKDGMRVEGWASHPRPPRSFTLLVEPKTPELTGCLDSAVTSWRLDVVWHRLWAYLPDDFDIRCHPLTRNKDDPCHILRSGDGCPSCASKECKLFSVRESWIAESRIVIFKGLGEGDQLRLHLSKLSKNVYRLLIVLETARAPTRQSLQLWSTMSMDKLKKLGNISSRIVRLACRAVFPPRTRVSSKMHLDSYIKYASQWESEQEQRSSYESDQ